MSILLTKRSLTASVLIRLVLAIGLSVAEQLLLHALAVSAGQLTLWADGLVCLQNGQDFPWLWMVKVNERLVNI